MADTAVKLLACIQLVQAIMPKVPDNAVGYSRIVVASPGVRRYTYDITHDPKGRDFSINFSPVDTELDYNNFLAEPEARFLPQAAPRYHEVIPVNVDYGEVQLNVKHPTHEEMEKSTREIQAVHSAYSKKPPQPSMGPEDFDLGIMGYGDFMDPYDEPRDDHQLYSEQNVPNSQPLGRFKPNFRSQRPAYFPQPEMSYIPKKPIYSKLVPQRGFVQKIEKPEAQYDVPPLNIQKALFLPAFDERRLDGLADKAYSKVFMVHGFAKPVRRFYPKHLEESEGISMAKSLFVPVVVVPSKEQTIENEQNIDYSSSAGFESKKMISKRA